MNLTSLRKSYATLLETFKEAGVVLTESQKNNVDNFMTALENKLIETRKSAIITTKNLLDEEYKTLTESLIKHVQENVELNSKIEEAKRHESLNEELVDKVDQYLETYVDQYLPAKTIVDYSRMQKLEQIHESLKTMLDKSDCECCEEEKQEDVKDKETVEECDKIETVNTKDSQEQIVKEENPEQDTKVEEIKEEVKPTEKTEDKVDPEKFLDEKVKDLPKEEASIVKESLKGASLSEIKMKFKMVLESAREQIEQETKQTIEKQNNEENSEEKPQETEKSLDEAIEEIVNSSNQRTNDNSEDQVEENTENYEDDTQTLNESENGSIVDESYMKLWMSRC